MFGEPRSTKRRRSPRGLLTWRGVLIGLAVTSTALAQTPEQIQRQREEAERKHIEYLDQKRRVDHINERVAEYKRLMTSTPFELAPGTVNMVQVYVSGHNIREVAHDLYFVSDGATEEGFASYYWPMVLYLNRASDYDGGLPRYGPLDPHTPEYNVAFFPNIRKQEYVAVVASISSSDSALAQQWAAGPVVAYRKRLEDEVARLYALGGEVRLPEGPARFPGEARLALFRHLPTEPQAHFPPRRPSAIGDIVIAASTDPVPVDRVIPLDPAPPAWLLRQGVNMLGPSYEGYNMKYAPERLDLQPEAGPIAFIGGRDHLGNPRTQPGAYFALNQRVFGFLLLNQSAFVVWSAGNAPGVNGGSLSAGLDFDIGILNLAGMAGFTGLRVNGSTETGPSFAGKIRIPITPNVLLGGVFRWTEIERFRVEERDTSGNLLVGRTGVSRASYFGLGLTLR